MLYELNYLLVVGIGCDCSAVRNVVTVRLNNVNVSIICCRIMIAQS